VSCSITPFLYACVEFRRYRNPEHTSLTDARPHVTAQLATDDQVKNGLAQTIHIYLDANGNLEGFQLYAPRDTKSDKDGDEYV